MNWLADSAESEKFIKKFDIGCKKQYILQPNSKKGVSDMFCSQCGKELPDSALYCNFCQYKQHADTDVKKRINLLAWSSMTLGIFALIIMPLGVFSVITGIVSLYRTNSDKSWRGSKRAWCGIFLGVMSISFYITLIYQFAEFVLSL